MTAPRQPAASEIQADLLARLGFLGDRLSPRQRMTTIVKLLMRFRETIYPGIHILQRADGAVVVTISPPGSGE